MKRFYLSLLIMLGPVMAVAQQFDAAGLKQLRFYEDSLRSVAKQVVTGAGEPERKNANYKFIRTLVTALKTADSYHYRFDSLKSISIVNAPDDRFRILAWHVLNNDGTYQLYGAIQMNKVALQLFPLQDQSAFLANPADTVTDNLKWYGARYYNIVQPDAQVPAYILLGWKGSSSLSTKKVIDVLSFANGKPVFGAAIFDGNGKTRKRVVFEYSAQATMSLRYIAEKQLIVFDHLSPYDQKNIGKFETYGPDMTYSGYKFRSGRWTYVDNLDMRNMPDTRDNQLTDPRKGQ